MIITKVTFRNRNDFHFIATCRNCAKESYHGDGYADAHYQQNVFPARHCEHCRVNEHGEYALIKADCDALNKATGAVPPVEEYPDNGPTDPWKTSGPGGAP